MRDKEEIIRAHDVLCPVVSGEVPAVRRMLDEKNAVALHAAHDALAWVLGYPCGESFAESVGTIEKAMFDLGYRLVDGGEVKVRERRVLG